VRFLASLAFSHTTELLELARGAEASGWDGVVVSDHVVHPERIATPYPYTPDGAPRWQASAPWPDPWVAIGAMAAVTRRLRFLTGIFVLPLRSPFLVAKAVGTAALLSNHRVALGIGAGWMEEEFRLLEQPFRDRGRRMDEMIEVLRKLWTGEMVEHHGRFYDFDRLQMSPGVPERIPIYCGGVSEAALRRAARLADGWISDLHTTEELRRLVARVRLLRAERGRAEEPFDVVAACSDAADADAYRRLERAGVTHLLTQPWVFYTGASRDPADKRDGLRRFADDVIAKLREP
jgi:probable F420-dependent oxidoreductase